MAEKTLAPSRRRLERAWREGDGGVSHLLLETCGFVVAVALLPGAAAATARHVMDLLTRSIQQGHGSATWVAWDVLALSGPLLGAAALAAFAAGLVQTQGRFTFQRLALDPSRLSLLNGAARFTSLERAFKLLSALLGAGLVLGLCLYVLGDTGALWANTAGNPSGVAAAIGSLTGRLLVWAALARGGLAALDLWVTRRAWLQRWGLSPAEARRELKDTEGDPALKRQRQHAHQALLQDATLSALRTASVLVVGRGQLVTALRWDPAASASAFAGESSAVAPPRVVAQGRGELAARMRRAAWNYAVPLAFEADLARALAELPVDGPIPEALYAEVAEVFREIRAD